MGSIAENVTDLSIGVIVLALVLIPIGLNQLLSQDLHTDAPQIMTYIQMEAIPLLIGAMVVIYFVQKL